MQIERVSPLEIEQQQVGHLMGGDKQEMINSMECNAMYQFRNSVIGNFSSVCVEEVL